MKFSKEFLIDSLDGDDTVDDVITGTSRWSIHHRRIFRHEGKLYETLYRVGATEIQDEGPYENLSGDIECPEVVAQEKTVTVYIRAGE